MATQKLYAGVKLREIRSRLGLTQKVFAEKLGVSLPYLNQMENNNRPVSTGVVLALAQEFGFDVAELSTGDAERLVSDMREAFADPVFSDAPPLADLRLAASNAPALAHALLELHRAYRMGHERLAAMDESLGDERMGESPSAQASPWDEVRDFFHYCDNYIDAVDRAAEHFATNAINRGLSKSAMAEATLTERGITIRRDDLQTTRHFEPENRILTLSTRPPRATQEFQLLMQVALITQDALLEATLDFARFQSEESRSIAKLGLANYFAGAALLPYRDFLEAADDTRHDLERLADRFGASIEQVAHRLSTCSAPAPRVFRFSLCGWIRRAQSPSATRPRGCNLPASAEPARCGMCISLEPRGGFAAIGADPGRGEILLFGAQCDQIRRHLCSAGAPLRHRVGVRGETRRRLGLCG